MSSSNNISVPLQFEFKILTRYINEWATIRTRHEVTSTSWPNHFNLVDNNIPPNPGNPIQHPSYGPPTSVPSQLTRNYGEPSLAQTFYPTYPVPQETIPDNRSESSNDPEGLYSANSKRHLPQRSNPNTTVSSRPPPIVQPFNDDTMSRNGKQITRRRRARPSNPLSNASISSSRMTELPIRQGHR